MAQPTALRDALRVKPGSRVRAREASTRRDARPRQGASAAAELAGQMERLRDLQDRLWAEAEALGPRRPPGHRCRRQGRHDRQGHGGVQPAGLPGHVVQGADRRGARPRLPVADPQAHARARARSASSTARTTRTSSSSASTTSSRRAVWSKRYDQINDFERIAGRRAARPSSSSSCTIDRDEQRKRFQARYDDPTKRWKFRLGDLEERKLWDDYQAAFEDSADARLLDRRRAVVRHPGQPQVVPQPGGRDDPGRHDRRPEAALSRARGGPQGRHGRVAAAPGRESRCGDVAPDEPRLEWRRGAGGERLDPLPR